MINKAQVQIERLKLRTDFVRMTHQSEKCFTPGFVLQYQERKNQDCLRIGFTASKKVGGAVERNRAKRRLRALMDDLTRLNSQFNCEKAYDIVLIARTTTLTHPYAKMREELMQILTKLGGMWHDAA